MIGIDGGLLRSAQETDAVLLSPGERVDLVVRGNREPGIYRLWSMPYGRSTAMGMGGMSGSSMRPIELAAVTYDPGKHDAWQMPERLHDIDPSRYPRTRGTCSFHRRWRDWVWEASGWGIQFAINGRTFDEARIDTRVRLGDVEDWEFVNKTMMDHPMHVHTNAFQIVQSDGNALPA